MNPLYEYLKSTIGFVSAEIDQAFRTIDRIDFVPDQYKQSAYSDSPLPLEVGATISQPFTVAFMINKLDPKPGEAILDIGSGSGWTTALLAAIVGGRGKVTGTEIIDSLVEFGNANLRKYKIKNAKIFLAGKELGLPGNVFDRILVSAAAEQMPEKLLDQLKVGGRLVIPIQNSLIVTEKISQSGTKKEEYPGFAFVPLR